MPKVIMTAAAYRPCSSSVAVTEPPGSLVRHDHGADPRVGEYLEQDRVRQPPVEHVRLRHAAADRGQAGLHLRDHPAAEPRQHRGKLGSVELADHLAGPLRHGAVRGLRAARPPPAPPRAGQSAYGPATSVSRTSFAAPSATATAAAAVSAFTLKTSPAVPLATLEITGIRPSAISARTAPGSTVWLSPTWPRSTSAPSTVAWARVAVSMFASSPDIPTANGPCRLISPTTSRLPCPVRTILTTSMASGVVILSPAANVLSMPSFPRCSLICGPPPCTTTGRRPAYRRNTTSCANAKHSSLSVMACPPNLITTVSPWKRSSHGSASISVAALASAPAAFCCAALSCCAAVPGCAALSSCAVLSITLLKLSMPSSRARRPRSDRWCGSWPRAALQPGRP